MFEIKTSKDFFQKLVEDLAELQDGESGRAAINCAITAYHMHEWIWGDWLNKDYGAWRKLGIRDKETFLHWVEEREPSFRAIQDIANGSKHFNRQISEQTRPAGAFQSDGFQNDAFSSGRIEIEVDGQWMLATIVLESIVLFWRDFFRDYSPYGRLSTSPAVMQFDFKD